MFVVQQRFRTTKNTAAWVPKREAIRENDLTFMTATVRLLDDTQTFVAGMWDLFLPIQDNILIPFFHKSCKAVPLSPGMWNLHAKCACCMVLKECEDDKGIPDMFGREGGTKLPTTARNVGFLLL
jgi:hypothetical protein